MIGKILNLAYNIIMSIIKTINTPTSKIGVKKDSILKLKSCNIIFYQPVNLFITPIAYIIVNIKYIKYPKISIALIKLMLNTENIPHNDT